jgi:hypothetical protein
MSATASKTTNGSWRHQLVCLSLAILIYPVVAYLLDKGLLFDLSVAKSRDEEEHVKKKIKDKKREEKEEKQREKDAQDREEKEWEDDEARQMAEVMGIPISFGGSKKPK